MTSGTKGWRAWLGVLGLLLWAGAGTGPSGREGFEGLPPGPLPEPWVTGSTGGGGTPLWRVEEAADAPSGKRVLLQSAPAMFPYAVRKDVALADGFVEVSFKPMAGKEDQAGGLIWRFADGDTYCLARANALEDNVEVYRVTGGRRRTLCEVPVRVEGGRWHRLRVDFEGPRARVSLDGVLVVVSYDDALTAAGGVGLWTKADSVTAFDEMAWGPAAPKP